MPVEDVLERLVIDDKVSVERRSRRTIMDGRVITYAMDFTKEPGLVGDTYSAKGWLEVSVSRNMVMIHRADLTNELRVKVLHAVIDDAYQYHERMKEGAW